MRSRITIHLVILFITQLHGNSGVWFSPDDKPAEKIITHLRHAEKSIEAALYTCTHKQLAQACKAAFDRGVTVSLIIDPDDMNNPYSKAIELKEYGISIYPYRRIKDELMHHKYCIIDETVLSGSMNWTRRGSTRNQENVMWCDDAETVQRFRRQHKKLIQRSLKLPKESHSWSTSIKKNILSFLNSFARR